MYQRRQPQFNYICYSRVTGQAVWVYQGQSRQGMKKKYYRTVASERKRKQQWARLQKARQANIRHLLDECCAALPILDTITMEQREAIRQLQQMIDNPSEFSSPLLDHDRERRHQNYLAKRRNRYWKDADFRQHEKERQRKKQQAEITQNANYDK